MTNPVMMPDLRNVSTAEQQQILTAARSATQWNVVIRPAGPGKFQQRVSAARQRILRLERELANLPHNAGEVPRFQGLQDLRANPRVVRSALTAVMPQPGQRDDLPRVNLDNGGDEPRVATLTATYISAVHGNVSASSFALFLKAVQQHDPLTLREIWSVPPYLNFALLEALLDAAEETLRSQTEAADAQVLTLFNSLRATSDIEWAALLEPLIAFDSLLRDDPTGTYSKMDFDTREFYRNRVARTALYSDYTETQVAAQALDLAREGARQVYQDARVRQRRSHIGYYLISNGFPQLAARVGYHPPVSHRIRAAIRRNADDFYITGIELITILFIAVALFPLLPNYPVSLRLVVAFLLMIMPAMQTAVEIINNSISAIFDPEPLPKLDFSEGIPSDCTTLVVVPTLLLNQKQVAEMVNELEIRYLANQDPNLHFALLTDLPDSVSKPHPNDSNPLVDQAIRLIDGLNARYGPRNRGGFLFLHRHRIFNVRQGVWMGWERKRGKLLDLNKLLVGEYDAFPIKAGRLDVLGSVRYILTLDSDTQVPRSSAAKMVGAIAHPLNQAIIDPRRRVVVEGYGILQPRIGVSVSSASRSRLAALYSGQSGFDIYTRAISDAYQDLYGEGIFTGKGIYEVAALHAVLNHRFPRNSLLSHDLIEGAYARAGLTTDIELIDDYPSHYSAYTRRKHRWVRGDWQIAQWMLPRVPDEANQKVPSPISTISRWKIFDNLRRSLVEPFTFILFVAGWLVLPGGAIYWTVVPLVLFFLPTLVQVAFGVGRAAISHRQGAVAQALRSAGHAFLLAGLNLAFLPHQAMLVLDAVARSLIRRFITGERLLEWETAAEAESQTRKVTPVDRYLALMPLIACALAVLVYVFGHRKETYLAAAPVLFLWCLSTVLTAWLNRPPREIEVLSEQDRSFLQNHALRIWRYFHEFGTERHSYLIPDNVEEKDTFETARVSPTNVGLLLNARQAACEFGFLTLPEYAHLTAHSITTIKRLEKFRGHLYNWYDTHNGQPLEANPFISTVDSGNFVASLYTLHAGTKELPSRPLLSPQLFTGLHTYWEEMRSQGRLPSAVAQLTLPTPEAAQSEWIAWIASTAHAFSATRNTPDSAADPWWFVETERRVHAIHTLIRDYMPWLQPHFAPLRKTPALALDRTAETLSVDEAIEFATTLEKKLATGTEPATPGQSLGTMLRTLLPPAIRNLRQLANSLREIAQDAERLADETEFGFLVNRGRHILSIGYDVRNQKLHSACYDMLASEARIATFLAVARGEMPQQGWFRLSRDYAYAFGTHVLMSWTGTMFEYLMPALWMRRFPNTLLSGALEACVRVQQAFVSRLGIPWGISESGSARQDDAGHYQYLAYGIPDVALFYEATAGPVISPYSTFLALGVDVESSIRNLRRMAASGWVGRFGFYESVDYTKSTRNGEVVREWMAHHQGMSLLALLNCLHDNVAQHWFHINPLIQSAELLLHEMPPSRAALNSMRHDFANVQRKAAAA